MRSSLLLFYLLILHIPNLLATLVIRGKLEKRAKDTKVVVPNVPVRASFSAECDVDEPSTSVAVTLRDGSFKLVFHDDELEKDTDLHIGFVGTGWFFQPTHIETVVIPYGELTKVSDEPKEMAVKGRSHDISISHNIIAQHIQENEGVWMPGHVGAILRDNLETVREEKGWLTDPIVGQCFKMIARLAEQKWSATSERKRVYGTITNDLATSRPNIIGNSWEIPEMKNTAYILIAGHVGGNHWLGVVVSLFVHTIYCMDSLGANRPRAMRFAQKVKKVLVDSGKEQGVANYESWSVQTTFPWQEWSSKKTNDCGVLAILYAYLKATTRQGENIIEKKFDETSLKAARAIIYQDLKEFPEDSGDLSKFLDDFNRLPMGEEKSY